MRAGSVPASSSRATRSVSTRVLPEPALAETQLDAVGPCGADLGGDGLAHQSSPPSGSSPSDHSPKRARCS